MKKKFLLLLIPAVLLLNAVAPRYSVNLILHELFSHHNVLVYSFVWVPLLEASVLVTEHIILAPSLVNKSNLSKDASGAPVKDTVDTQEFIFNSGSRESVVFRKVVLKPVPLPFVPHIQSITLLRAFLNDNFDPYLSGFLLLPVTLLSVFKPLLPRSDIAAVL